MCCVYAQAPRYFMLYLLLANNKRQASSTSTPQEETKELDLRFGQNFTQLFVVCFYLSVILYNGTLCEKDSS